MNGTRPRLDAGDRLGDYELVHALGQGAFACVWRARRHGEMGFVSDAALKLIPSELFEGHAEIVAMFADEARVLGLLHHPNVADVHWFGRLDSPVGGFHGLAMEWVDGTSLAEAIANARLAGRGIDPTQVRSLLEELADALHTVHALRDDSGEALHLIHRDIKPSNILITPHGHAKLLDFGVARSRFRLAEKTSTSGLRGTLQYMSPEQAASKEVGPASDLWSLGAVAFEALTGKRLIERLAVGSTLEAIRAVDPAEVQRRVAEIAPDLAPWVATLLVQDPADRPTAQQARDRLSTVVARVHRTPRSTLTTTIAVSMAPASPADRAHRHGLPIALSALALLLGMVGIAAIRPTPSTTPTTVPMASTPTPTPYELALDAPEPAPSATPVRVATAPPIESPGRVRVGSDATFELLANGTTWNLRDARTGVELPAGRQKLVLRCTSCASPIEAEHTLTVRSGETHDVYVPLAPEVP